MADAATELNLAWFATAASVAPSCGTWDRLCFKLAPDTQALLDVWEYYSVQWSQAAKPDTWWTISQYSSLKKTLFCPFMRSACTIENSFSPPTWLAYFILWRHSWSLRTNGVADHSRVARSFAPWLKNRASALVIESSAFRSGCYARKGVVGRGRGKGFWCRWNRHIGPHGGKFTPQWNFSLCPILCIIQVADVPKCKN